MKQSYSWSNIIQPRRPSRQFAGQPLSFLITSLLWVMVIMNACSSSSPPIPPQFDAIERMPVHTIVVESHTVAYLDVGAGEPVILIHGFGGSMWQWEYQQHALSPFARVITLDVLGSGLSDKPDIAYTPDQMIQFFVGFMDALNIQRATLVGNSMGAGLAIGMALTHPGRINKLVLIDGLPSHILQKLTSPTIRRALESRAPSWLVSFGNWLFGGLMVESILQEIVHDPALLTPAVIERSNRNRQRPGLISPVMRMRNNLPLWEAGFATRIGEIHHPTLVLWGEEDRVFPLEVGRELQRAIPDATLVSIPEAGHIPQWERPDLANQAMIKFLSSPPDVPAYRGGT